MSEEVMIECGRCCDDKVKEVICMGRVIAVTFDLIVEAEVENIEIEDLGPLDEFDQERRRGRF